MKPKHETRILNPEEHLREVEQKLVEQLHVMIALVEDRVGPGRIEQEYAYMKSLISSRDTRLREVRRMEDRNALA